MKPRMKHARSIGKQPRPLPTARMAFARASLAGARLPSARGAGVPVRRRRGWAQLTLEARLTIAVSVYVACLSTLSFGGDLGLFDSRRESQQLAPAIHQTYVLPACTNRCSIDGSDIAVPGASEGSTP